MNLILIEPTALKADATVELTGRRAAHLREVMGVDVGRELRIGVIGGERGSAVVRELHADRIVLEVNLDQPPSPRPAVDLILAMPRPKVLRRLLGVVAAHGVGRVDIVNAWRVDKSYLASPLLEVDALRDALLLGCEQGGTTWLPEVAVHPRLMGCLHGLDDADERLRVLAEPGAGGMESLHPLQKARVLLAIGPEGGWIQRELDTFVGLGFVAASLGSGVLRVEAAVVSALAQLELLSRLETHRG